MERYLLNEPPKRKKKSEVAKEDSKVTSTVGIREVNRKKKRFETGSDGSRFGKRKRMESFEGEINDDPEDDGPRKEMCDARDGFFGTGDKKYHIILADPPWKYDNDGCRGGTRPQYATMRTDDIKDIPVQDLAADHCTMFMWCTSPKLGEGIQLMNDWGFSYIGVLTWAKLCKNVPKLYMGLGWWFRNCCEYVLFGRKGKPLQFKKSNRTKSLFFAPRPTPHSRKPDEFKDVLIDFWGENYYRMNKMELFAREIDWPDREWDTWGDELEYVEKKLSDPGRRICTSPRKKEGSTSNPKQKQP